MKPLIDLSKFDLCVDRNYLEEYFGVWAIHNDRFETLISKVQNININAHIAENRASHEPIPRSQDGDQSPYALSGGIAQIELVGPMMKYSSSMSSNVSTIQVRRQLQHAVKNDDVSSILLRIDSPGGTVSGTADLAAKVREVAQKKHIVAFVEDLAASAAYWVASQANRIVANNSTALVGSIGTYTVIYDMSRQAENLGIKTHLIRAGHFKGAGTPGTSVSEEQLAEWQRLIDALNNEFKDNVARGRNLSEAALNLYADGRVHGARVAVDMGLIDGVQTLDATFAELQARSTTIPIAATQRSKPMANSIEPKAQATIEQLEAICPDSDFVMGQFKQAASVEQATAAYNQILKAELEQSKNANSEKEAAHQAELEKARAEAEEQINLANAVDPNEGVNALGIDCNGADPDAEFGNDPKAAFDQMVAKAIEASSDPHCQKENTRSKAVAQVAKRNPELHRQMLIATNKGNKRKRLITEKYEDEAAS